MNSIREITEKVKAGHADIIEQTEKLTAINKERKDIDIALRAVEGAVFDDGGSPSILLGESRPRSGRKELTFLRNRRAALRATVSEIALQIQRVRGDLTKLEAEKIRIVLLRISGSQN